MNAFDGVHAGLTGPQRCWCCCAPIENVSERPKGKQAKSYPDKRHQQCRFHDETAI